MDAQSEDLNSAIKMNAQSEDSKNVIKMDAQSEGEKNNIFLHIFINQNGNTPENNDNEKNLKRKRSNDEDLYPNKKMKKESPKKVVGPRTPYHFFMKEQYQKNPNMKLVKIQEKWRRFKKKKKKIKKWRNTNCYKKKTKKDIIKKSMKK